MSSTTCAPIDPEMSAAIAAFPVDISTMLGSLSDGTLPAARDLLAQLPMPELSDQVERTDHEVPDSGGVLVRVHRPVGAAGAAVRVLDARRWVGSRRPHRRRRPLRPLVLDVRLRRGVRAVPAGAGDPVPGPARRLLRRSVLDPSPGGRARRRPGAHRDRWGQRRRWSCRRARPACPRPRRAADRLPAAHLPDDRRPPDHRVESVARPDLAAWRQCLRLDRVPRRPQGRPRCVAVRRGRPGDGTRRSPEHPDHGRRHRRVLRRGHRLRRPPPSRRSPRGAPRLSRRATRVRRARCRTPRWPDGRIGTSTTGWPSSSPDGAPRAVRYRTCRSPSPKTTARSPTRSPTSSTKHDAQSRGPGAARSRRRGERRRSSPTPPRSAGSGCTCPRSTAARATGWRSSSSSSRSSAGRSRPARSCRRSSPAPCWSAAATDDVAAAAAARSRRRVDAAARSPSAATSSCATARCTARRRRGARRRPRRRAARRRRRRRRGRRRRRPAACTVDVPPNLDPTPARRPGRASTAPPPTSLPGARPDARRHGPHDLLGRGRRRRPRVHRAGRRVRQGARAVRPADRHVPGGQAPLRQHARRHRAGDRGGVGRRARPRPPAASSSRSRRRSPPRSALPAADLCAKLNIQVHGGIGFTWEHDAHLYLRRAAALAAVARRRGGGDRRHRPDPRRCHAASAIGRPAARGRGDPRRGARLRRRASQDLDADAQRDRS